MLHSLLVENQWIPYVFIWSTVIIYGLIRYWIKETKRKKAEMQFLEKHSKDLSKANPQTLKHSQNHKNSFDTSADTPISFGYKTKWIAIKNADNETLLGLLEAFHKCEIKTIPSNWLSGLTAVTNSDFGFITPPIQGWTLVVDNKTEDIQDPAIRAFLSKLSEVFGEAQYFGNHRVVGYGAAGLFKNGTCIRAFSYADGTPYLDLGEATEIEKTIISEAYEAQKNDLEMIEYYKSQNNLPIFGHDEQILKIAENWSVNPLKFNKLDPTPLGLAFNIAPIL